MVRQTPVPHNTPKSDEVRKSVRSNSKVSYSSVDKEKLRTSKHLERIKKRHSHGSDSSKVQELLKANATKSIHEVHCSCDRLHNELLQFVGDFVNSQEYRDYLEFKRSVIRKDEAVQYDANDLVKVDVVDMLPVKKKRKVDVLRALSRKALRVFFLEVQIEKYLENMKNSEILMKQMEAINTIRQKIGELKCIFFCHREEKLNMRKEREQALVRRFINRHNIDISKMISTNRLDEVILDIERKLTMRKRCHKNNTKIIVEKLLKEYIQNKKEVKKIKELKHKKEKSEDQDVLMHLKGRKGSKYMISSMHIIHKEDAVMKYFKMAGVCIKESRFDLSGRKDLWDKSCLADIPNTTSDKGMQKKALPLQIPQEDNMYKIKLDENAKYKLGIMESFVQFEDLMEARHFFCTCEKERKDNEKAEINYPDDDAIISNPDRITFKDFEPGKIYSKKLTLRNKSGHPVRIRFFKIYCEEPKHSIYFEIDYDEIKIARPGLPVNMTVKFNPPTNADVILGTMVFLTCCGSTYCRYIIPIECVPAISDITIEPRIVNFGTIPIWKFHKNPPEISKVVKVRCSCKRAHKLIINKVKDPLELETTLHTNFAPEESSSSSEESVVVTHKKTSIMLEMEQVIKDILKELDNKFYFDRRYIMMNGQSREQSINISLPKIENAGFFFEKYRVDIYDVLPSAEKYKGMQEIVITLEVSDYFIRCDPVCVDFGICFYGTAYQATFGIINNSRTTHSLSIRIPSTLSYYVSLDENCIFIKSGEIRRIAVKFLPSQDFTLQKCKYFDQDTFILYFPIEVRLADKKYACVPPITEHCYAIINDCSDLTLDPIREHFKKVDGRMVLDMGDCSVSEAITTQIVLRNSSYSSRYYGFSNLPRWMTIMPKYGFGLIHAFQEITLDIFIHPQVEDFESTSALGQGSFREDRNHTISVETVANLGKYRRKPNMNRLLKLMRLMLAEMRRKTNIELLESIFVTKRNILAQINLCSCADALQMKRKSTASSLVKQDDVVDSKKEESDTSDASKAAEDEIGSSTVKLHKRKKKILAKLRSGESVIKKIDSVDSTPRRRRKSSKFKSSIGSASTLTPSSDEQLERLNDTDSQRRPSLFEKKSVAPFKRSILTHLPHSFQASLSEILFRELRLTVVFVRPLYEFSYNHLEFPVTPGGSYSMMTTELRPLKFTEKSCVCNFGKEVRKPRCRSTFRIAGSTQEMRIEPTYGVLEDGESIKLTLVATPKISDDLIAAYAYEDSRKALYDAKMEQELKRREEAFARKSRKSKTKITWKTKKGKKEMSVSVDTEISKPVKEEEDIIIEISPEEVKVEYSDLYPAELALWRSIEPYFLNTNFVCRLDYEMDEPWSHSPDILSLETVCKVVCPDFIHDQKTQHLDFGQVPIGDCERKIVTIQNLKYHDITVTTSILRPGGGFFCPNFDSVKLPSECFLKIPITYTPNKEESVLEYMEIKAERSVYRFLLSAEAAVPNVRLEPSSKTIRVVSKRGKLLEVSFEIVNDSRQPVRVSIEKVCEIEGIIVYQQSHRRTIGKSDRILKKKTAIKDASADNTKTFDSSTKKNLRSSYSDELTEEEIYSIENQFSPTKGFSYFRLSEEDKKINLQESSKKTVKIQFGPRTSSENPKPLKRKDRRKSITEINVEDMGKTIVAKFNLLIGTSYFLRDFIILGEIQ